MPNKPLIKTNNSENTPCSIYWKCLLWLVLTILLLLTLIPSPPKPINIDNIDKAYHLIAFAGFTFIFMIAFNNIKTRYLILLSVSLGIIIEAIQYYVPNRSFSLADIIADSLGVFLGFISIGLLKNNLKKQVLVKYFGITN